MKTNLKFNFSITQADRIKRLNQKPKLIWFTGLPCSGKSTLANALEVKLFNEGIHTYLLDGDNLRSGINQDLGFSTEDRKENLRRVAEIAKILLDAGIYVIAAFISPLESDRDMLKKIIGEDYYFEIFVNTPIEECEARDSKGLFKKARANEITNFTGVNMAYEIPAKPDLIIDNSDHKFSNNINIILQSIAH
jgi:adenylyl-sulfate kinase